MQRLVHRKYLIGFHKYHSVICWIPKYYQHTLLIRQSWGHASLLWGRTPPGQSFDSVSEGEDKVRVYWKLEIWFKAGLSMCMSVEECGWLRLVMDQDTIVLDGGKLWGEDSDKLRVLKSQCLFMEELMGL